MKKKILNLLTTNARLALARPHTFRNHIGKVTYDVYHKKVYKKKVKQRCWMILKLETMRWSFSPPNLPFWTEVHRWRTNHVWPFLRDNRCVRLEAALRRTISVWHQSTARAIRKHKDPSALLSLSRYFDVIHWSFCAAPLQVEHTLCNVWGWASAAFPKPSPPPTLHILHVSLI